MLMQKEKLPLNASVLKLIACATMLLDHIGAIFYPEAIWMRLVGRIAMPIYCFMIAEGAVHTRNKKKYLGRMVLCAFVAEIPFDLAFRGKIWYSGYQNVLFTLSIGLAAIYLIDLCREKLPGWRGIAASVAAVGVACALAELAACDYGYIGVLMVLNFRFFRSKPALQAIGLTTICSVIYMLHAKSTELPLEIFAAAALVPIFLYNGKKGFSGKAEKIFFYAFYPTHLLLFGIIQALT